MVTQGGNNYLVSGFRNWVSYLSIEYSLDNINWNKIKEGCPFKGNTDVNTKVKIGLP